jgi:hypothetical protein
MMMLQPLTAFAGARRIVFALIAAHHRPSRAVAAVTT